MIRRLLFSGLFLSTCAAFAAGFNGRWDLTVINEPRRRAWWLEVEGAGTPGIHGRFVGFPGGNINAIPKIAVEGGVLKFSYETPNGKVHIDYAARLKGGKLEGTMKQGKTEMKFVGVRAPKIADKDNGSWKEGRPVEVFNGKDLGGWHGVVKGQNLGWTVENGILKSDGKANNLESDATFWNFKLHAEFRLVEKSNSGIGLRGRYEIQIQDDYGKPVDAHSQGALYSRIPPRVNASRKPGEWQTFDIRLVGRNLTVVNNGQEVVKGVIEGLTAIAVNADEGKPGPLVLQGDHQAVEFRKITLTPLVRK